MVNSTASHDLIVRESRTQHNQVQSPLLRFPAELKNQIYAYVLGETRVQTSARRPHESKGARKRRAKQIVALLFTCRQIRHETVPLFYTNAIFDLRPFNFTVNKAVAPYLDMARMGPVRHIEVSMVTVKNLEDHLAYEQAYGKSANGTLELWRTKFSGVKRCYCRDGPIWYRISTKRVLGKEAVRDVVRQAFGCNQVQIKVRYFP